MREDPAWKEVLMGFKGKATSQTKKNQKIRKDLSDFMKMLGV
jgi:cytochrome c551/c552